VQTNSLLNRFMLEGIQMNKKNRTKGFSLLELLIVVAIILIIATIAVPSLLRSRQASNESAAVGDMRSLNTAEATYSSSNPSTYGPLTSLVAGGLIDSRFQTATTAPIHGQTYAENVVITDPTSGVKVGDATPGYYGFGTTTSGNAARYDYASGTDAVVRYNTIGPNGTGDAKKPVGQ
jgi:prepilin-type N-terminal cleavage/methylation domain-containing protein